MPAFFFFFNDPATTEIYTLSLHDALPIFPRDRQDPVGHDRVAQPVRRRGAQDVRAAVHIINLHLRHRRRTRSEEHTSELQSRQYLVCRLLLEKKKKKLKRTRLQLRFESGN